MRVLVTGTASGIGRGIAEKFIKEGHEVIGFDVKKASLSTESCRCTEDADSESSGAQRSGGKGSYTHYVVDIRDEATYPELPPVDILINNAGTQSEQGLSDIEVNLKGTIQMTERYGIHPGIRSVVMIGSASGHTGSEFPAYAASKGGVLTYAKNVAMRIAPYGGTCNSLDFGGVETELNKPVMEDAKLWQQIMEVTPLKRWMSVEEAAEWVYFISVINRFCTGQNILIDGLEAGNCNFVWPE